MTEPLLEHPVIADDPLLPADLRRLVRLQLGLLTPRQALEAGVDSAAQRRRLRSGRRRRPVRGVLDVAQSAPADLRPDTRARRAAVLALLAYGSSATSTGFSALALHGVWGVPLGHSPEVTCGTDRRDRDGLRSRAVRLSRAPVALPGARSVAHPVDALAQSVTRCDPRTALGLLDSALHRRVVTPLELAQVRALVAGRRGAAGLEAIWSCVDARRASPPESWAWYDLTAAGFRPTDVQVELRTAAGELLARGDIGFRLPDRTWLLLEVNGWEHHRDVVRDAVRRNAVVGQGGARMLDYWTHQLGPRGEMVRQLAEAMRVHGVAPDPEPALVPIQRSRLS